MKSTPRSNPLHLGRRNFFRSLTIKLVFLAAATSALFTGCKGDDSSKKTGAGDSEKRKIAIVISTLNNPWFGVLADTAKTRCNELGYEATVFDSANDPSKEAANFDNLISGKFSAVLFNCTDADGSIANVKRAKAAGIPVFCMDREINSNDAATSQVLSDSYSGCITLGKYFIKRVGEKGKYVELLGIVGDNNTKSRSQGFHSVVDKYTGLQMVAQQSANFDRAKAMEVMESILQANGDINAVFCGNDAMAMGAYQALKAAGKSDKVLVFGFDGADDVVKAIADGNIAATMMQYPKVMARTCAESADKYIKGERTFPQKTPVAVDLVNKETVEKFADHGRKDAK